MSRGIRLEKTIKEIYPFKKYLNPNKVYLPLVAHKSEDITVLVKKDDYVVEGDMVAKSKGDLKVPLHAPISGKVLGFEQKYYLNNKKVKCLVIENDFVDQLDDKEYQLYDYTKEEVINKLKESGVVGLSGTAFPTYVKYDNDLKTLIVNAVESDPDTSSDAILINNKCEEILEVMDALVEIFGMNEGIIAIKKNDLLIKKIIKNYIGTYVKLKLVEVPDYYASGWERDLVWRIKKEKYKNYPIEKGIVVNGVATMYAIYETLKYHQPLIQRVVTFSGDKLEKPANVLVKNGTLVSDVIDFLGGLEEGSKMLIANGPLMGESIASYELVVSSDLTAVSIITALEECKEETCLRCGACVLACPAKLSPVLINEATDNLKQFRPQKCVGCGLCSYVCPANINLRNKVQRAKEEIA